MNREKLNSLDFLFKPRNVAIYEAKKKISYFINGFIKIGFDLNNLFLISYTEKEISGIKCYNSINEISSDSIDLLILAVKREHIIDSMKEILSLKKVNFIHIFTAGTGEADEQGKEIENQIKEILDETNGKTRAIGPNCMGAYCPKGKNAYHPLFPREPGNIGLIFHSGDLHTKTIIYGSMRHNLRFSKGVSVGNCVDLQFSDFLNYYNNDDETDIIGVYFEGFSKYQNSQGKRILNALKSIIKPVLFLRGGKSQRAKTAVLTHTGSMGSDEKMWQALFKQTHVIDVGNCLDDMIDHAYLFYKYYKKQEKGFKEKGHIKFPSSKNALVILWSGGLGILDTDILIEMGINLPYFEGEIKKKLQKIYPLKVGSLSNPLDLPWIARTDKYVEICKAAISENIDLVIIESDAYSNIKSPEFKTYYNNICQIKDFTESLNKLFMIILPEYPARNRHKFYNQLIKEGFIVFPSMKRAAKAYLAIYNYGQRLKV